MLVGDINSCEDLIAVYWLFYYTFFTYGTILANFFLAFLHLYTIAEIHRIIIIQNNQIANGIINER